MRANAPCGICSPRMRVTRFIAAFAIALNGGCASPASTPDESASTPEPAPPLPDPAALTGDRARVGAVRDVGPYLEAQLRGRGGSQGFLFVASEPCRRAIIEGAVVRLTPEKPLVRVTGTGGAECRARGLASLAAWRDAIPARRASFLVVTAPAELELVSEGDGLLIAQGKLPLATELRWPNPLDIAAVLPDTPACRAHLARDRTEMEFRQRGDDALILRGRLEPCPVLAIAEPVFLH
jgi:hypothetical protein